MRVKTIAKKRNLLFLPLWEWRRYLKPTMKSLKEEFHKEDYLPFNKSLTVKKRKKSSVWEESDDVIEFIGIYTSAPDVTVHQSNDGDEVPFDLMEDISVQLPPSEIPRLHCITSQKLSLQDLVSRSCANEALTFPVAVVREALLRHLTAVLGNDALAAQFTLLHLLSRVRARVDVAVVGKLSLNLTGFTRESSAIFGDKLIHLIQELLPFSKAILLSVDRQQQITSSRIFTTTTHMRGIKEFWELSKLPGSTTPSRVDKSTNAENNRRYFILFYLK